jgi:hypothetical protein
MHFAQYPDEETAQLLSGLESFAKFRMELKESKPVSPPQSMKLTLVGAAFELFN